MHNLATTALQLGLSVVPPREDGSKAPLGTWKQYMNSLPTQADIDSWYLARSMQGIGVVTGRVSGGLECLDFDNLDAWAEFCQIVDDYGEQALFARICAGYQERSPKGMHLLYRCESVGKSQKLARRDGRVLIETRGEGGYVILAPTAGSVNPAGAYTMVSGGMDSVATITPDEREVLFTLAAILDAEPAKAIPTPTPKSKNASSGLSRTPGDDFNARHTWHEVLTPYGWECVRSRGEILHWRKPGSKKRGAHATTGANGNDNLYVFSTEALPFDGNSSYSRFAALALLEYGGDYSRCAADLAAKGYGDKGGLTPTPFTWGDGAPRQPARKTSWDAAALLAAEFEPVRYLCPILPEGCIILGGSPKVGKSWLSLDICLCANSGGKRKLFGIYDIAPCDTLYISLEDSAARLKSRIEILSRPPLRFEQHMVPTAGMRIELDWPRIGEGCIERMQEHVQQYPDTRLIIVDTLARVRPASGKNANAYELDYAIVSSFQAFALAHRLTVLLITHLRKSDGDSGDPFERITGSMGISGAADASIILQRRAGEHRAKLYTRGRDVEDQTIMLDFSEGTWLHCMDGDAGGIEHADIISICLRETKRPLTPAEINRWLQENDGIKIANIRRTMLKLWERGCVKKIDGKYGV